MTQASTEQIAVALTALVATATGLQNVSRVYRHPSQVRAGDCPIAFVLQDKESVEVAFTTLPAKRRLTFRIALMASDAMNAAVVPATQINAMRDAIETALLPQPSGGFQNLGVAIVAARVEGDIEYLIERTADPISVCVIPVVVTRA